jgi:hypothetical protein
MTGTNEFVWDVPHSFNFGRDVIDPLASEQRTGLVALAADGSRRDYTFSSWMVPNRGRIAEWTVHPTERARFVKRASTS